MTGSDAALGPRRRGGRARRLGFALGAAVALALLGTSVSPIPRAWSQEATDPTGGSPVVGGFGVSDGIEAMIDERDGALRVAFPAGGLALTWDSRAVPGGDRFGLGPAWALGLGAVDTAGGVRFSPASGGRYEVDASHPSGLLGYGARDIAFRTVDEGTLPARDEAGIAARAFRYRLHEPGGVVTSFDERGNPIERSAPGGRTSWEWNDAQTPLLQRVVDPDGVVTELTWSAGELRIRPGANLPVPEGSGEMPEWRVELADDGIAAIVDPTGGRLDLTYAAGLVTSIAGVAGARTEVEWQPSDDGAAHVARLVSTDRDGVELSRREWSRRGSGGPSGWPEQQSGAGFLVGDATYETELGDGSTAVRSVYTAFHTLRARRTVVTTAAGERVVQEQTLRYPSDDSAGQQLDPGELAGDWNRPTSTSVTFFREDGAERTVAATSEFDDLGRPVRVSDPDGTVAETVYDDVLPPGALVPVGLPQAVTTTAADGQTTRTVHTFTADRTAVTSTETLAGRAGEAPTATGAVDYTVEADGFVSEQRTYPSGDRGRAPVVTKRTAAVDLAAATSMLTEVAAVGTSAESSVSVSVSLRHGGVLEQSDAVGNRATTEYDALGRPVRSTDPSGLTTTTSYETAQQHGRNAVTITAPDGVARTEVRDGAGRVRLVTDNLEHGVATPGHVRVAETREYEGSGTVVVTDAWGAKTVGRQDVFGRPIATESPTGVTQLTNYDPVADTVTTAMTPTGAVADAEVVSVDRLDAAGRTIASDGSRDDGVEVPTTSTRYDGLGRVVASDDGSRRAETIHDVLGNPVTTTLTPRGASADPQHAAIEPDSRVVTERRFDPLGASLGKTVTDATGAATGGSRAFDAAGRVVSMTDQADRVTSTEYTADGLVARVVDGNGQVSEYAYDDRTRQLVRTTIEAPGKPAVETIAEYDDRTGRLVRIAEASDPGGTEVRYSYDDFGNVRSVAYPGGTQISHQYDEHGRRVATTDATGATTTFAYRIDGLMTSAVQRESAAESSAVLARVAYRYDELGRVSAVERGNGVATSYTFTSASEIARESTSRDGVELSAREYEYSPSGMLLTRVDRERDEQTGATELTTTAYRYDALDRLVESTVHDGASVDAPVARRTAYTATVSGDVATEVVTTRPGTADAEVTTRAFAYSELGELTAISTDGAHVEQTYDAAGNLIRGADGTSYAYDAANRPISRTHEGQTVQTSYWGGGARRSQLRTAGSEAPPTQTTYYWDGDALVNDVHTGGDAVEGAASYLIGVSRHSRTTTGEVPPNTTYYGTDRHGNVTDLTDEHGEVLTRYGYSDYGVQTNDSEFAEQAIGLQRNPFGYAGEQADDDGSLYLRARVYDPVTMRFISEDEAERFDRYNYADLNPIMLVDPSGHAPEWDEIVDLVTGGLALASFASSTIMAAFTGGLSLTGLGIMALASDVVTVLAVTARSLDRELPDLEILDHDGENMLLGVEIAFGAFGLVGVGADISQLGTAEKLFAVKRDLDRVRYIDDFIDTALDPSGYLARKIYRIDREEFGGIARQYKYNVELELADGDHLMTRVDQLFADRQAIVSRLSTFQAANKRALDGRPFPLVGYGTRDVLSGVKYTIDSAADQTRARSRQILFGRLDWSAVHIEVNQVRKEQFGWEPEVAFTPPAPPPPGTATHYRRATEERDFVSLLDEAFN